MANKLTIFDVAGRSMAAQQVRLNTVASNLANAASVSGSPDTVYRPIKPVFETQYHDVMKKRALRLLMLRAFHNRMHRQKSVINQTIRSPIKTDIFLRRPSIRTLKWSICSKHRANIKTILKCSRRRKHFSSKPSMSVSNI